MFDCCYEIGTTHQICQDYCKVSNNIGALSDGCSSSSDVDIGARLAVLYALTGKPLNDININHLDNVSPSFLDVTLWRIVNIVEGDNIIVEGYGDGVQVVEYKDNTREIFNVEYENNAPYYISYLKTDINITPKNYAAAYIRREYKKEDIKAVHIFSDGILSFEEDVLNDYLDIKLPSGVFVKRKFNKLKKLAHYDDLSMVSLFV